MDCTEEQRTIWCGNLSEKVTEELLYELFLQAGPLEKVKIPLDREGRQNSYAFITFKHSVSVPYATQLLNGIALFTRKLNLKPRTNSQQPQIMQQSMMHSPQNTPNMSLNEINNLMLLGSMLKSTPKMPSSYENNHSPNRRDRNFNKDIRYGDKPYGQNYRVRNHRNNFENYGNNHRSFYSNNRNRR